MADISYLNIGGSDYGLKDATARTNSENLQTMLAYKEDGNTASQAYAVIGTPINWKGSLYYTKTAVAAGTTWTVGTNLTAAPNLGKLTSNIKTYVNDDGQLVFRDLTGADTVLPFSGSDLFEQYWGKYLVGWGYTLTLKDISSSFTERYTNNYGCMILFTGGRYTNFKQTSWSGDWGGKFSGKLCYADGTIVSKSTVNFDLDITDVVMIWMETLTGQYGGTYTYSVT